jgi:hypothetical protein
MLSRPSETIGISNRQFWTGIALMGFCLLAGFLAIGFGL